jgi:prevent-host-death family protein
MEAVSIEEASRTLDDLVDRARLAGEPSLITRHGKSAAVVVNVEWYGRADEALETAPADDPCAADVQRGRHELPFWLIRALPGKFTLD